MSVSKQKTLARALPAIANPHFRFDNERRVVYGLFDLVTSRGRKFMKKQILAVSVMLFGMGALAFLLVRAERIIQLQQQALKDMSAKAGRLEGGSAAAPSSPAADEKLKAEVDGLRRSVASLQAQLGQVQKKGGTFWPGRVVQKGVGSNIFDVMPTVRVMPDSQAPAQMPPGAVPFEFNGATYYRIPLADAR
jgi:hypothetical protein